MVPAYLLLLAAFSPVLADIGMMFKKYPQPVAAPVGDEVAFDCVVNVPGDRLAWRWRPVDDPRWRDANGTTDKTSTRLTVNVKEDTPTSLYQCVVWYGGISLVSVPARLSVARVELGSVRPNTRVISSPPHNTVVLHCKEPVSEPPAVITWWKENKGSKKPLETPHGVLVLHNVTSDDSGMYGCSATNEPSGRTVDLPEKVHLKIQHGHSEVKFLESEEYVGNIDNDGVLTVSVRPREVLRLWCGAVGSPPPRVVWSRERNGQIRGKHGHMLVIDPFTADDEDVYSCSANEVRRSWKVIALQAPSWEGSARNVNATEGGEAHIACGIPHGQPPPTITWVLNSEPVQSSKGNRTADTELFIRPVEKRHAGVVQCFACNSLGCAYEAAMLTVVPKQISEDMDYSAEAPKTMHSAFQAPKRHRGKNPRKHKVVMMPPSRPNVTRLSDTSVMVSWTQPNHGLTIQFYKVQYKEVSNISDSSWQTGNWDIQPHIHACEVDTLHPNIYYKFRIAAVYSNQDNKQGRSSTRFLLQRGVSHIPRAPQLTSAEALSPHTIQLNWTWSIGDNMQVQAEGFYIYYRALASAGIYDKVAISGGGARSYVLSHLTPDTAYEAKVRSYTTQAASEFSRIVEAKTHRSTNAPTTTTEAPVEDMKGSARAPDPLVTAGGALGAVALLVILAVTLLLCRRAKRPPADKEKGSVPETGGANGYIQAKVPITITANPMHAEGGDGGVEMSFLHNNNCGNNGSNDDTLPHSRKNGPTNRQYV
ncbi:interference hedgehog-like [Ostrinia furnacalis]|uniref:interference hedgehog-like n=1 Tax=Ostrinia furnacalis TaxID=93504 RepID=UPI00103E5933|nr:interference hedgehog-like [Ostrinia furnacalis]